MSLFKDKKLKTVDVEVQGVNFTLTEPSALDLCLYFDAVDVEHAAATGLCNVAFE